MLKLRQLRAASVLRGTAAALLLGTPAAHAAGVLEGLKHHTTVVSTITDNGDLNPYAVVVAPVSSGMIHKGDVLVDNFNNQSNLQGTGGTIIVVDPASKSAKLFAKLPQNLPQCPGGIGLSTAMTMLSSGCSTTQATPIAVCLYRTLMSRHTMKYSSSRYSHTSLRRSSNQPLGGSMRTVATGSGALWGGGPGGKAVPAP